MESLPSVSLETAIPYVAAAYVGIWVILFGYLVSLGGKLAGLRRQVDALADAVKAKGPSEKTKAKV